MKERKFYLQLGSGEKFEISEIDFNNIDGRIGRGATSGWYAQRGILEGASKHGWKVAFKDVAAVWASAPENKDRTIRKDGVIDINKRKMPEVGKIEKPKDTKCKFHNWDDSTTWHHITNIVGGMNRYYKMCPECKAKSTLIKKREVELAQLAIGETLDTVLLVE